MKIHHFGFLAKDLKKTVDNFILLGHKPVNDIIRDFDRGVDIIFLTSNDNMLIEIVSPYTKNSVVSGLIKNNNNKLYHIAYLVDGIDEDICALQHKGFILIDPPKPAIAFGGKKVAFLISSHTGIIELIEK